jgi:hypothetical protein
MHSPRASSLEARSTCESTSQFHHGTGDLVANTGASALMMIGRLSCVSVVGSASSVMMTIVMMPWSTTATEANMHTHVDFLV